MRGLTSVAISRSSPRFRGRDVDDSLFDAYCYWVVNRGVYQTPGKEEQWTISIQHSEADIDRFVEALAGYCRAIGR